MKYISTRGGIKPIGFEEAVLMGLGSDGGLIVPSVIPKLTDDNINNLSKLKYSDLAFQIIKLYAPDYDEASLKDVIDRSYSDNFRDDKIIPIYESSTIKIAELFHGPTFAFKDMALQFLGNLFEDILIRRNRELNIVGATSGDTGSAAIYGMMGKKNINIFILFPNGLVSPVQEMQMTSVLDNNVYNLSVNGNFDDCQNIVKAIFNDNDFKDKYNLGAINSINWARILAQVVYYFYIYFNSVKKLGDKLNVVVPTGNFGNIFALYIAKRMGLNIDKTVLATNSNNILSRAINNGDYTVSNVVPTLSPSMDIQIASNFERYLYYLYDESSAKVNDLMNELKSSDKLNLDDKMDKIRSDFASTFSTDKEILSTIDLFYNKNKYVVDPHTACGVNSAIKLGIDNSNTVVLATAHPAKFVEAIEKELDIKVDIPNEIKSLYGKDRKVQVVDSNIDQIKKIISTTVDKK